MATLLTIVQDAMASVGLPVPPSVVGNTDDNVRQALALVNTECTLLARESSWQALTRQHTFTTVAQEEQTGAVPSDFDRFLNGTWFDRDQQRDLSGPLSAVQWQALKAIPAYNSPYLSFRIRDNDFLCLPEPAAGDTIAFEYVTKNWCESSTGTGQDRFQQDSDVPRLDATLIVLGLIWRFLKAKQLDYREEFMTYEREKQRQMGASGGAAMLTLSGLGQFNYPVGVAQVPIGSWPG